MRVLSTKGMPHLTSPNSDSYPQARARSQIPSKQASEHPVAPAFCLSIGYARNGSRKFPYGDRPLYPPLKDALWLARRRRELKLARRITCRAGRRILRALSTWIRRVPVVRKLPCLRQRRRRRKKIQHEELEGSDSESGGAFGHTGSGGKGGQTVRIIDVDKDREQQHENSNRVGVGAIWERNLPNHDGSGLLNAPQTVHSSIFSADGGGERPAAVQIRPGTTDKPLSKAAAAAMAKAEENNTITREGRDHRSQRAAQSIAGCFGDYLDRRTLSCMGLESALEAEREACDNAREEYILALSDFESDHSLEITW